MSGATSAAQGDEPYGRLSRMIDGALRLLRCPHCGAALDRTGAAARCTDGHSFDLARQGYLSLLSGDRPAHTGDTADMVAARERFLAGGHFDALADALAEALPAAAPETLPAAAPEAPQAGCLVDLGAGTGWYLARVLDLRPEAVGLALDVSKPALRRAARAHPRMAAVACDVWGELPVRDGVAGAVLNVFAPRNAGEIARILVPGGSAFMVTAAAAHLAELREPLGLLGVDERKEERLDAQLEPHLRMVRRRELEWPLRLDRSATRDLAAMGPSAFHLDPAALEERIATLAEPIVATAAVTVTEAVTHAAAPRARAD